MHLSAKGCECSAEGRVAVGQVATAQVRTVTGGVGRPRCPLVQEKHFPEIALPFLPSPPHPMAAHGSFPSHIVQLDSQEPAF